eukprot:scaffold13412_cov56-Skeletonema_dohrnii-CCMP3373.AAC.1
MSSSDADDDYSTTAVFGTPSNRRVPNPPSSPPVGQNNNNPLSRAPLRLPWTNHQQRSAARSRRLHTTDLNYCSGDVDEWRFEPTNNNNNAPPQSLCSSTANLFLDPAAHPPDNVATGGAPSTPHSCGGVDDARNTSVAGVNMDLDESAHSSLGSPVSAAVEGGGDMKSAAMSSSCDPPTAASQQPPRPGIMQSAGSASPGDLLAAPPPDSSSATSPRSSAPAAAAPPAAVAVPSPQVVTSGQQHVGGSPSQSPSPAAAAAESDEPSHLPEGFNHAIAYVNTVKMRFLREDPEVYGKFLVMLNAFQSGQRRIEEVLDEVLVLFADHADLLRRFSDFFPDNIRSQAEAQLESAAAAAEERANAPSPMLAANAPSPLLASPGGASPESDSPSRQQWGQCGVDDDAPNTSFSGVMDLQES